MNLRKITLKEYNDICTQCMLSEEEKDILDMLARKQSISEISIELMLSSSTVNRRIKDIKDKVGAGNV